MMPMADIFAPDINFVPVRAVYPTAQGGTSASAGGAMNASTNVVSADAISGDAAPAVATNNGGVAMSQHTVWYWVGLLILLVSMVVVSRKVGGPDEFRNIRPSVYNVLAITLTAIVGIVGLKVVAAKYRVPGLSEIILSV